MVECGPTASGFHLDPRHQRDLRELSPLNGDRAALHASLWRITNSRSDCWSITPLPVRAFPFRAGNTRSSGCFREVGQFLNRSNDSQVGVDLNRRATRMLMMLATDFWSALLWPSRSSVIASRKSELLLSPTNRVARPGAAPASMEYSCWRRPGVPSIDPAPLTLQIITALSRSR